jgi:DNA-binding CsgD family transcriptional regulator
MATGRFGRQADPAITGALDSLQAASSQGGVWAGATAAFARLGSVWLTCGVAPAGRPHEPVIRTGTPRALMDDYLGTGLHRADRWMHHCATSALPDAADLTRGPARPGSAFAERMRDVFTAHGVAGMVLIPCHRGIMTGGIVTYADSAEGYGALAHPDNLPRLRLLAAIFATAFDPSQRDDAAGRHYAPAAGPALTPREAEVLTWLATGLQTDRIADRLGIAPVTVVKHLASARAKLGARTREQALALALLHGQIRP